MGTLAVSHLSPSVGMAWLNAAAPLNMPFMVVTRPVFHLEMSALNCALFLKRSSMSVIRLTSQSGISVAPAPVPATPQSAPAAQQPTPEATSATHASTAALSFDSHLRPRLDLRT